MRLYEQHQSLLSRTREEFLTYLAFLPLPGLQLIGLSSTILKLVHHCGRKKIPSAEQTYSLSGRYAEGVLHLNGHRRETVGPRSKSQNCSKFFVRFSWFPGSPPASFIYGHGPTQNSPTYTYVTEAARLLWGTWRISVTSPRHCACACAYLPGSALPPPHAWTPQTTETTQTQVLRRDDLVTACTTVTADIQEEDKRDGR